MAWRTLHISNPARLSLLSNQIQVHQNDGPVSFPLEDLAWILLDTREATLTSALISACMRAGTPIIFSDEQHMPCGVSLPFHQYYAPLETLYIQLEASSPLQKRIWQHIIKRKIKNQARALRWVQYAGTKGLESMTRLVKSGDPDNVEARAARYYWLRFFDSFQRSDETDVRNLLLNYGYSVVRASIARYLCLAGFIPSLGIHHDRRSNAFNLADDLLEPFRPVVDCVAWECYAHRKPSDTLTRKDRQTMATVLSYDIIISGEQLTLLHATERSVETLKLALVEQKPSLLALPETW